MYKLFVFLCIIIVGTSVKAQPPGFVWAKQLSNTNGDIFILSSTTDASGNLITTGAFDGTVDFDPGSATEIRTDAGFGDIFVSKTDSSGNFLWVKQIGKESYDQASSIITDAAGNIYVTGFFSMDSTDFNPGTGTSLLSNPNNGALTFLMKLDAMGNLIWAKELGPESNSPHSIALDPFDNILITGIFGGTLDFDPGPGIANVTSLSSSDIFILKLNSNGDFYWVKQIDVNTSNTRSYSIAADGTGNIFLTGLLLGTVDFDPSASIKNLSATSIFGAEYILKLDSSGNYLWAKAINGSLTQTGSDRSIVVDPAGNSYTAGWFGNTVDFDPDSGVVNLSNTTTSGGSTYLLKLNSTGILDWVKQIADPSNGYHKAIALDANENICIAGTLISTGDFNPGSGSDTLSPSTGSVFVAKYNAFGNLLFAINFANDTVSTDHSLTLNIDADGNIYTTGVFSGTGDFDPGPGLFNMTSNSPEDIYFHKMNVNYTSGVGDYFNCINNWSVYPNPANLYLKISSTEAGEFSLMNSAGQMVNSFLIEPGNEINLSLKNLSSGIYYIVKKSGGVIEKRKIVVMR